MKHPVLRVKKGTESYDDREDKLAEAGAEAARERRPTARPEKRRTASFLRIRRGSLLPLFILILIAAVILRVLPRSASRATIDGWHVLLEARVSGDTLDVGVAFSRLNPGRAGTGMPRAVSVLFILPETGQQTEAFGALSDSRFALLSRMRYEASVKTLRAIVRIDGQSRALFLPIRGP